MPKEVLQILVPSPNVDPALRFSCLLLGRNTLCEDDQHRLTSHSYKETASMSAIYKGGNDLIDYGSAESPHECHIEL